MCGIVGAVSTKNIVPILIEGLKRLEYRGYDSCGVAVHQNGELRRARSTARVAELESEVASDEVRGGSSAIGLRGWLSSDDDARGRTGDDVRGGKSSAEARGDGSGELSSCQAACGSTCCGSRTRCSPKRSSSGRSEAEFATKGAMLFPR